MTKDANWIKEHFKGSFISSVDTIQSKLKNIKAFVFDWDGVFNNGIKDNEGTSPFNEVDAMGTNMLRFNYYLQTGRNPIVAIISGEQNKAAKTLGKREHFHAVYSGIKFKVDALQHLSRIFGIKPEEIAFVFDDVLDLSVAKICGLRIMVGRQANPLLIDFAVQRNMVDYLTACSGHEHAVRETAELITGLSGHYNETLEHRMDFSNTYQRYLKDRNITETAFYTIIQSVITQQSA